MPWYFKAKSFHLGSENSCISFQVIDQLLTFCEHFVCFEWSTNNRWCNRIREQISSGFVFKDINCLFWASNETSRCASHRFSESWTDKIYFTMETKKFWSSFSSFTNKSCCMAFVNINLSAISLGDLKNFVKWSDITVHWKNSVGYNKFKSCVLIGFQLLFQIFHIEMLVPGFFGFT